MDKSKNKTILSGLSLQIKFLIGIAGIVILLGLAVTFFVKFSLQQTLLNKLQKRGISIANNIASASINPLLTERAFELVMLFKDFKNSEDYIEYIFALDQHGRVIAHTFEQGFPVELKDINRVDAAQKYSVRRISTEKGDIFDIAVPLFKGEAGFVHLGISKKYITEDVNSIIKLIVWLVMFVLVLGSGLTIIFSRIITGPLLELSKLADVVSRGDLDQRVFVGSSDEIGQLANSFNQMTVNLKKSRDAAIEANTELNYTLMKIADEKAKTEAIIAAMGDGVSIQDTNYRILYQNHVSKDIYGDHIGEYCYKAYQNKDHVCERCHLTMAFRDGMIHTLEQKRTTDMGLMHYEITASPVMDSTGKIIAGIELVRDITGRKKVEEELEKYRKHLESLVEQRTAEALRAKHLASIGELAAGVAHEINNPINSIINYGQILSDELADSPMGKDLSGKIMKEGDRIAAIVHSLLSFGRETKDEKKNINLCNVFAETLALTDAQIRRDGIHLETIVAEDLPLVVGNSQQIQQVFLNVISNARYALNSKYPGLHSDKILEIKCECVTVEDVQYVRLSFLDHGTGIPPGILDKAVQPFFSTKPAGHGTGLGLSIIHGIIRDHGGRLALESKEGEYTRVIIDLPVKI